MKLKQTLLLVLGVAIVSVAVAVFAINLKFLELSPHGINPISFTLIAPGSKNQHFILSASLTFNTSRILWTADPDVLSPHNMLSTVSDSLLILGPNVLKSKQKYKFTLSAITTSGVVISKTFEYSSPSSSTLPPSLTLTSTDTTGCDLTHPFDFNFKGVRGLVSYQLFVASSDRFIPIDSETDSPTVTVRLPAGRPDLDNTVVIMGRAIHSFTREVVAEAFTTVQVNQCHQQFNQIRKSVELYLSDSRTKTPSSNFLFATSVTINRLNPFTMSPEQVEFIDQLFDLIRDHSVTEVALSAFQQLLSSKIDFDPKLFESALSYLTLSLSQSLTSQGVQEVVILLDLVYPHCDHQKIFSSNGVIDTLTTRIGTSGPSPVYHLGKHLVISCLSTSVSQALPRTYMLPLKDGAYFKFKTKHLLPYDGVCAVASSKHPVDNHLDSFFTDLFISENDAPIVKNRLNNAFTVVFPITTKISPRDRILCHRWDTRNQAWSFIGVLTKNQGGST
ncbi:hypothetical protein GEMRC1_013768 [Eukaryota sp. GEM-RC1]